jgi:prophage maintenance system killer protein
LQSKSAIEMLKSELIEQDEATLLFGQERDPQVKGIFGNILQTFWGQDVYPSIEEKAAHLLYFIIKDHPFIDGNKRIGSFFFLLFQMLTVFCFSTSEAEGHGFESHLAHQYIQTLGGFR